MREDMERRDLFVQLVEDTQLQTAVHSSLNTAMFTIHHIIQTYNLASSPRVLGCDTFSCLRTRGLVYKSYTALITSQTADSIAEVLRRMGGCFVDRPRFWDSACVGMLCLTRYDQSADRTIHSVLTSCEAMMSILSTNSLTLVLLLST